MREGWKKEKLGAVCKIEKIKYKSDPLPYVGLEDIESGTGKFLGKQTPVKVLSSTFRFGSHHILYGRLRPYLNKVLLPDFEGHCSSEIFPFRPTSQLEKRFFYYWITGQSVVDKINRTCTGTRMPRANVNKIMDFIIPLPPLSEQKCIVAILDETFAGISTAVANTEKNLANARELFESYLNSIFNFKGKEWQYKKLGALTEVQSGGTPLKSKKNYWDGDIPWYSSGELNDLSTAPSKSCITKIGLENSNAKMFPKGSLLIGMYDTAALKMSLLDRTATFNQAIAGVKPSSNIDLRFVLFAVQFLRPYVLQQRRGVRQKNLSLGKIKGIEIPVPELKTQKMVVDRILAVKHETKHLESLCQQKLAALAELKQSLLQKAFSGELTAEKAENEIKEAVA